VEERHSEVRLKVLGECLSGPISRRACVEQVLATNRGITVTETQKAINDLTGISSI